MNACTITKAQLRAIADERALRVARAKRDALRGGTTTNEP